MLMWRASNAPSRENIEGESDGPNEIEMIATRTGGQKRDSRAQKERRTTDEDIIQYHTNTLAITPLTQLPNKKNKKKNKKKKEKEKKKEEGGMNSYRL